MFFKFFVKVILWTKLTIFDQSETPIAKQFFLNLNYGSLFLVWYCLVTCVNCVANCVTQKFTPLGSKIYKLFLSMSFYGQFRQLFHVSEPTLSKQFFSKLEFLFSVLGSMVSKNICKLCHKLKMPRIYPNSLGHDKINLDVWLFSKLQDTILFLFKFNEVRISEWNVLDISRDIM